MKDKNKEKGIGGWMILSVIQLILYFLMTAVMMVDNIQTYEMTDVLVLLIIMDVFTLILSMLCLIFIFLKRKIAINTVIWFHITNILCSVIIGIMANYYFDILSPFVVGVLWILYYLKSERVKETLVN